jgi:hypothetical protein
MLSCVEQSKGILCSGFVTDDALGLNNFVGAGQGWLGTGEWSFQEVNCPASQSWKRHWALMVCISILRKKQNPRDLPVRATWEQALSLLSLQAISENASLWAHVPSPWGWVSGKDMYLSQESKNDFKSWPLMCTWGQSNRLRFTRGCLPNLESITHRDFVEAGSCWLRPANGS